MNETKIKYLESDELEQWNSFVDLSPQGDVFCYSWWLDAITGSRFKVLAAIEDKRIVAGIPMAFDSTNRINEPPLTRTLGVLFKSLNDLSEYRQLTIQRRWLTLLMENFPVDDFVQMCMHHEFKDWLPLRWKGLKQTTKYTYLIRYADTTEQELWHKLIQGRKNSVTRALNNNISAEETDDFSLLYKYCCLSYQRQGLTFRIPFGDLQRLDNAIRAKGNRLILKTSDKSGQIHAVSYFAFNKRSAYYLLSGSEPAYRKMGGHTLAVWEAIKYFRDKVAYFNFGGSDIKPIEEHVRGFGGTLTPYFHIYNDKYMDKNSGIRYHLKEAIFHSVEAFKGLKNKFR